MNTTKTLAPTVSQCDKIRDQITAAFTKLPMPEQLALNVLLVEMIDCAYDDGFQTGCEQTIMQERG